MPWKPALTFVVAASLAACGTSAGTGAGVFADQGPASLQAVTTDGEPVGTYRLVSIDGHPVPYAPVDPHGPAHASPGPEIVTGTIVLGADGTFRSTMAYRIERDGSIRAMEREFTGTWVREGPGYRLDWDGAGQTPATLEGDTFTYDNVGMLLAYRRQI
jgi:hypothetical protein